MDMQSDFYDSRSCMMQLFFCCINSRGRYTNYILQSLSCSATIYPRFNARIVQMDAHYELFYSLFSF